MKTADFNKDGKPDLAISNTNNDTVSILLGNGDGTFQARNIIAVANSPFSLALGDFNQDGNVDIVTSNYSFFVQPGTVSILLGNGDGTFQAPVNYPAGKHPYYVSVGRLTRDHHQELAVVDYGTNKIQVLLGNGNGTFGAPHGFSVGALNPFAVKIADFNGDRIPDLATSNFGSDDVSVLLGRGDGTFGKAVTFPAGNVPEYFDVGDFNGGRKSDLAVPLSEGNAVAVLLNTTP